MHFTFQAAAAEALHRNNVGFVTLAREKFGNLQEGPRPPSTKSIRLFLTC